MSPIFLILFCRAEFFILTEIVVVKCVKVNSNAIDAQKIGLSKKSFYEIIPVSRSIQLPASRFALPPQALCSYVASQRLP